MKKWNWWRIAKPDRYASILLDWQSAERVTGLSDGNTVSPWADLSGNGRDATQATDSLRPTYQTSELGTLPVIRFDGTDDYLELGAAGWLAEGTTTFSIFVVYRITQTTAENMLLSSSGNPATAAGAFIDYRGDTANDQMDSRVGNGTSADSLSTNTTSASGTHIYVFQRDGTNVEGWIDGTAAGSVTDNALNFNTTNQLRMGAQSPTAGVYLNGDLAEIFILGASLNIDTRHHLSRQLGRKWRIAYTL